MLFGLIVLTEYLSVDSTGDAMTRTTPLDWYAEAIPFEELLEIARSRIGQCNARSRPEVYQCALQVVRQKLCPCAASEEQIVNALVDEFLHTGAR